jgi:hypothetical protein
MNGLVTLFLLLCGIAFFLVVLWLLLKAKINERLSIVWLSGSFLIFLLSGNPKLLDEMAALLGISYPPSLLFLLSTLVLLAIALYQSIQISRLNEKMKELTQYMALSSHMNNAASDELRKEGQSDSYGS